MKTISVIAALTLMVILACAPRAAPTPSPVPTPVVLPPASPMTLKTETSPEDGAWAKVVEAAKKEGKVVAYSFYLTGDVGVGVAKAFKAKYGIDLEIVSGPGSMLTERIKSEQRVGQNVGDLFNSGVTLNVTARKEGITRPVANLPVLQESGAWYTSPQFDDEGFILTTQLITYAASINTNLVKPEEEPRSWKDLLQPRWKDGKIVTADPSLTPMAVSIYWGLTSRSKLDKAYFVELGRQGIRLMPTAQEPPRIVGRGESHLGFGASESDTAPLVKQGLPIKMLDMKEGVVGSATGAWSLVDKAPHANAARLFLNWFLSKEGQETYVTLYPVQSIRKDVPDLRPAALRIVPTSFIALTSKDEEQMARIIRERELFNLFAGK